MVLRKIHVSGGRSLNHEHQAAAGSLVHVFRPGDIVYRLARSNTLLSNLDGYGLENSHHRSLGNVIFDLDKYTRPTVGRHDDRSPPPLIRGSYLHIQQKRLQGHQLGPNEVTRE